MDPKLVALRFNECISNRDVVGLGKLMTEDYVFIDSEGNISESKKFMIGSWTKFFEMFPLYRNTFERVESHENIAVILGFAYWSEENDHDPSIWTATIVDDLISEWRIYHDTEETRKKFGFI